MFVASARDKSRLCRERMHQQESDDGEQIILFHSYDGTLGLDNKWR